MRENVRFFVYFYCLALLSLWQLTLLLEIDSGLDHWVSIPVWHMIKLHWLEPYLYNLYYMRILSVSAILVWNTPHTADYIIHVRGAVTLTVRPYGSIGTCIINYAPPRINVVIMTLGIVWLFVTISRVCHNQRCITIGSVIPAQTTAHSSNKWHRIELM